MKKTEEIAEFILYARAVHALPLLLEESKGIIMARRALIIEDNPDIQYILQVRLELYGYTTFLARDGCEALELLPEARPNIILLDLGLPGMDGYTFLDELERRNYPFAPAIIVLTADHEAPTKLAQRSVSVFLKPFPFELLFDKIKQFD
jgi:CheY-like chemotaxis protein